MAEDTLKLGYFSQLKLGLLYSHKYCCSQNTQVSALVNRTEYIQQPIRKTLEAIISHINQYFSTIMVLYSPKFHF